MKATKHLKCSDAEQVFNALFTKNLKLKKPIGKAQKSWSLVNVKRDNDTNPESRVKNAKSAVMKLLSNSAKSSCYTFGFERQHLGSAPRYSFSTSCLLDLYVRTHLKTTICSKYSYICA